MNVVFEGGGIKGLAYIGALRYLEDRGIRIKKAAGTSVGAIIASLVASGYRSGELEQIIAGLDENVLWPKKKKNKLGNTAYVIKNKAIYSIKPLENIIRDLLSRAGIKTFRDLKVGNNYKLKIVVTSVDKKKMIILPEGISEFGIDPDSLDVASAVCMSASLPFVYPPYVYHGHRFVDGGIMENFPIWVFNESALGFRVNKDTGLSAKIFKTRASNYQNSTVIYIDATGYKATDFRKGMKEKYVLYNRGYYYTKMYFDNRAW